MFRDTDLGCLNRKQNFTIPRHRRGCFDYKTELHRTHRNYFVMIVLSVLEVHPRFELLNKKRIVAKISNFIL